MFLNCLLNEGDIIETSHANGCFDEFHVDDHLLIEFGALCTNVAVTSLAMIFLPAEPGIARFANETTH